MSPRPEPAPDMFRGAEVAILTKGSVISATERESPYKKQ